MEEDQKKQLEQGYKDLIELDNHPTFRRWRDSVELVFLNEIDQAKEQCLGMNEADLKALVIYEAKVKKLFAAFRSAKALEKSEK